MSRYAFAAAALLAVAVSTQAATLRWSSQGDYLTADPMAQNELLTNSLRHAFPESRPGRIDVVLRRESDEKICVTVRDNGIGLPGGSTLEDRRSTGLTIVTSLARQLGGVLTLNSKEGLSVCLTVPAPG